MLRLSARPGRQAQPSAERIAPCWPAALRPASPGLCSAPRRRREPRAGAGGRRPGAAQPEFRLRARPQEAFHPEVRASVPHRDVQAAASEHHRGSAWPLERARHRAPATVILQPEARPDVRRAAVRPGDQPAVRPACCPEPASQSAQVLSSVQVQLWAWRSGQQALPGALWEPQVPEPVLPWEMAQQAAPQEEQLREAVPVVWGPGAPQAAVSVRAAAGPRPEAATAASEPRAAEVAAEAPDELRAAAEAPQDAAARQPEEAQPEDAVVPPRAAVPSDVRVPQAVARLVAAEVRAARRAAVPSAAPSEAASVFRQGPFLAAGPARPQAAARFAHAMRSLRIASRSEPSWQAARSEGWSYGEIPRKVL